MARLMNKDIRTVGTTRVNPTTGNLDFGGLQTGQNPLEGPVRGNKYPKHNPYGEGEQEPGERGSGRSRGGGIMGTPGGAPRVKGGKGRRLGGYR